ncbi:hypothetical protein DID78_04540 [Candidatus Marinamargulisbacteria bacterium SCGC AG-343-D04]|nr:hypothetical protein DID78_04540 [Candidatus Marinamargulisbacteria bacterium SCGC AG-343-D04]
MIIKTDDYTIECTDLNLCKIFGSMRLPSPLSYNQPFSPIKSGIEDATDTYIIDITELKYLNSSGITSLARLIIVARKENKELRLLINNSIPWQKRSLSSLTALWEKLEIKPV